MLKEEEMLRDLTSGEDKEFGKGITRMLTDLDRVDYWDSSRHCARRRGEARFKVSEVSKVPKNRA